MVMRSSCHAVSRSTPVRPHDARIGIVQVEAEIEVVAVVGDVDLGVLGRGGALERGLLGELGDRRRRPPRDVVEAAVDVRRRVRARRPDRGSARHQAETGPSAAARRPARRRRPAAPKPNRRRPPTPAPALAPRPGPTSGTRPSRPRRPGDGANTCRCSSTSSALPDRRVLLASACPSSASGSPRGTAGSPPAPGSRKRSGPESRPAGDGGRRTTPACPNPIRTVRRGAAAPTPDPQHHNVLWIDGFFLDMTAIVLNHRCGASVMAPLSPRTVPSRREPCRIPPPPERGIACRGTA